MWTHREDQTGERILEYGQPDESAKPRADVHVVIDTKAIQHVVTSALGRSLETTCSGITSLYNHVPEPGWLTSPADTQRSDL